MFDPLFERSCGEIRLAPPVVQEQLATALLEPFQVGISRVQHAVVGALSDRDRSLQIERSPVPIGIPVKDILCVSKIVVFGNERAWRLSQVAPCDSGTMKKTTSRLKPRLSMAWV